MNSVYRVDWKRTWKSLSIFMSASVAAALIVSVLIRYVSSGFDYAYTFKHLSIFMFILIILAACIASIAFTFFISLWFKVATIRIEDGFLHGRNYWGFRKRIPLDDIETFSEFSNNGINAVIVKSRYHGQICIYEHTERKEELFAFLVTFLPEFKTEQGAAANP